MKKILSDLEIDLALKKAALREEDDAERVVSFFFERESDEIYFFRDLRIF